MVLVILCCLFVFLGMYIGRKFNLKYFSINFMFGLFLLNCLIQILPNAYSLLSINYHDMTFIYVFLGVVIGVVLMMLFDYKSDNCDDISIIGFTMVNTCILCNAFSSKFSLLLFIINVLYYVSIGIYIKDGRSFISVIIGLILGLLSCLFNHWFLGYFYSIIVGVILCFVYSISIVVTKCKDKYAYVGLILGMLVAFLGSVL